MNRNGFARNWVKIIREWSNRDGQRICGWWFDGDFEHIRFNEAIAQICASAAKHGNPHALVTFDPGVKLIRYTKAENYTAGELPSRSSGASERFAECRRVAHAPGQAACRPSGERK
jgi:hypothetical protein